MGKLLAILAASAAVAGGATFAVFHHLNPNSCPLGGCEVTKPACCVVTSAESASPADPAVAAAGPVGLFATVPTSAEVSACCAAKPAPRVASCCATSAACCATVEACCPAPGIAALVGPAAAVR